MGVELLALDQLIGEADFVTIHLPKTKETTGIIGRDLLLKAKPSLRVINVARGGIVDEAALAEAIESGQVAGAALDVFEKEPPPPDHPLLKADQLICTPHLGAATAEAQVNVSIAIAEQVIEFLLHNQISNAVNVPSVSAELFEILSPYVVLGEKLGSLQAQLLKAAPQQLTVEYAGDVADVGVQPVTVAVLRGLLNRLMESSAAPAKRPSRNASARAFSSTMPPRAQLIRRAVGFIFAIALASISFAVSFCKGTCRETKSDRTSNTSRSTSSTPSSFARSAVMNGSKAITRIVRPCARAATRRPMLPRPTIPSVLLEISLPRKRDFSHLPFFIDAVACGMERARASIMLIACSAVVTLLPPGVFITTTPRRVAAGTSTLSTPIPARPITRNRGAAAIRSAVTRVELRMMSASVS
jgi:hypothetical protein